MKGWEDDKMTRWQDEDANSCPKVTKRFAIVAKDCQKLSKIAKSCRGLPKLPIDAKDAGICQNLANWQAMTWWHDVMLIWWLDDLMTWWLDGMMTLWHYHMIKVSYTSSLKLRLTYLL